ncbi:hypothetical protein A2U01_0119635, partial [Trifolium medium]|nr:hypothetical protein [Trifolium medium]
NSLPNHCIEPPLAPFPIDLDLVLVPALVLISRSRNLQLSNGSVPADFENNCL